MESAGNDIVALSGIDKDRTNNERFYRQILSVSEQQLFRTSVNTILSFDQFVWLAWSVKESAYKYRKRLHPQLVFSPTKIIIQQVDLINEQAEEYYRGSFTFDDNLYYFKSRITNEWIASVVNDGADFDKINWGIRKIHSSTSTDQSIEVRRFLLEDLNIHFPSKCLQVSESNGQYPVIKHDGKTLDITASFAHHDFFVSYAYTVPCLLSPIS